MPKIKKFSPEIFTGRRVRAYAENMPTIKSESDVSPGFLSEASKKVGDMLKDEEYFSADLLPEEIMGGVSVCGNQKANLVTSKIPLSTSHAPVIDLDVPCELIPSQTPGHFHLYIHVEVEHGMYMNLLSVLADAGIVEEGYYLASKNRGYSALRIPLDEEVNRRV